MISDNFVSQREPTFLELWITPLKVLSHPVDHEKHELAWNSYLKSKDFSPAPVNKLQTDLEELKAGKNDDS